MKLRRGLLTQAEVNTIVEKRLAKCARHMRSEHAAELERVRAACRRDLEAMSAAVERLRTERNELLNATWSLMEERDRLLFVRKWVAWFADRQHINGKT